jgi:hypothetical protein
MRRLVQPFVLAFLVLAATGSVDAAITPPAGNIPNALPPRMLVGLFEQWGGTWLKDSGVPWDVRYAYFTKGWSNNWGWGAHDGSMGTAFFNECATGGFIPAVQYYQMNGEVGGGEAQFYSKTQSPSTMATYFGDFKLLMQRAKDFGKPVIVMLEGDGFAYMQQQSGNNPNAYSAIADSGLAELAGIPNTAAGWGLAFLQIRKSVGASNVVLGMHISAWASGKDIAYGSVTDPLQPEVDKVYSFLAQLGLAANKTGATYDFLVGDPLDRDSDFYVLTEGQNRWWDASDSASINSKSFNRYAEWLRLWNVKSSKRWILWQIPLGNSNHLNVYNNGGPREGYKDNRPEYFFGTNGRVHLEKFASSGVIALLFGAGAGGQSSYGNDVYTDGQLFMKSRAGAFLKAGGLAIPATGGATTQPPPTNPPPSTSGSYDFESNTQGWVRSGAPISSVARATTPVYSGSGSLRVNISGSGSAYVSVANPTVAAGKTVTFHVYVPSNTKLSFVQPFVMQGANGGWTWTGNYQAASAIKLGAWNTWAVQVPANASALASLGVQIGTSGSASGSVYVDKVTY